MTMDFTATWTPVLQCTILTLDIDKVFLEYLHTTLHIWIMLQPVACMDIMEHLVMYHKPQIIWVLLDNLINVIRKLFMGKIKNLPHLSHRPSRHHTHDIFHEKS